MFPDRPGRYYRWAYVAPLREATAMQNAGKQFEARGAKFTHDAQVYVAADIPTPQCSAKLIRLKYFSRVVAAGPHTLFRMVASLLAAPGTWPNEVWNDIQTMWRNDERWTDTMPEPAENSARWFEFIKEFPREVLLRASRHVVRDLAPRVAAKATDEEKENVGEVLCPECGKPCHSEATLASHRAAKHGVMNQLRRHVSGTMCRACDWQFHGYERLYRHVRYSTRCAEWHLKEVLPMEEEVVAAVMAAAKHTEGERDKRMLKRPAGRPVVVEQPA